MRYRSIDHSRVSWGRQCPVNCIKCATSTLGRRIDFVTLPGESDFMAKRVDLIASIKTTFISPGETLSSSKGKPAPRRGTYVQDEKFRTIFCKINERPCCSSLSGPWLVLDQTRRPIDHVPRFTRLLTDTTLARACILYGGRRIIQDARWRNSDVIHLQNTNSSSIAEREGLRRVLGRSWSAFDDFASKLPRRNTDNSLPGKCFASKSRNRNGIIVA